MYQFSDGFWSFGSLPLKKNYEGPFRLVCRVARNGINKPTKNAACAKHDHRSRSLPKAHSAWRVCQRKDVDCSIGLQYIQVNSVYDHQIKILMHLHLMLYITARKACVCHQQKIYKHLQTVCGSLSILQLNWQKSIQALVRSVEVYRIQDPKPLGNLLSFYQLHLLPVSNHSY